MKIYWFDSSLINFEQDRQKLGVRDDDDDDWEFAKIAIKCFLDKSDIVFNTKDFVYMLLIIVH